MILQPLAKNGNSTPPITISSGKNILPPLSATPAVSRSAVKPTVKVIKQEDKGLDFGRIKTALTSSIKAIPGTVKVAAGIVAKNLIDQQKFVNDFFSKSPIFGFSSVALQNKILEPLIPKAEEKAKNLREQGIKEIAKAREPFAKLEPPKNKLQKYAELITFNLPQMAATTALTIGTAIVTKNPLAATAVGLSTSYGLGASEVYEEARNQGVEDDKSLALSMMGGAVIGALDFVPLGRLIRKTGAVEEIKRTIIKKVATTIVSLGKQSGFEGITEALQEIVGNAVSKTYNEKRNLFEGVTEAAIVGFFLGGLGDISVQGVVTLTGKNKSPKKAVEEVKQKIVEAVETKATDRTAEQKQIVETVFQENMTPDQAAGTVLSVGIEKTQEGKDVMKAVVQAMQEGKNLSIDTSGDKIKIDLIGRTISEEFPKGSREGYAETGEPLKSIVTNKSPSPGLETNLSPSLTKTRSPKGAIGVSRYVSPSQVTTLDLSDTSSIQNYATTLRADSQVNEAIFAQHLEEITGIKPAVRLKKLETIIDKIGRYKKAEKDAKTISDILGGRIVTKWGDVETQIKNIQENFEVVEIENFFNRPTNWGYTGVNIRVRLPNGMLAEIQVHTSESLTVAEKIHTMYEKWRSVDERSITDKQLQEREKDRQLSKEIALREIPEEQRKIGIEEQKGKRVLNTKEVGAIKDLIDTKLTQIREGTGNARDLGREYEIFYNDIVDKANSDKVVLSALRTGLSKEMFGLAGATGENYKANYAQLQTVISQDEELGPVLSKLEDYIVELDKKLLTAQEPARVRPNIEIKKIPSEKRPTTPSKEEPVGTGKPKNSKLFERVKETLGAEFEAQNRKYNVLDLEQQAEGVIKLIDENPKRAARIARGLEEPPSGITQNAVGIALAEIARESGDFKTAAELWTKTSLRSTRLGQEIVSLRGDFGIDGPLNAVKQVLDAKMQQVLKKYNDIIKGLSISEKAPIGEKIDALLTHEAKKLKQKINGRLQSADAIFAQLTCK